MTKFASAGNPPVSSTGMTSACMPRAAGRFTYLNVLNSTRYFASMRHQNGGANPFAQQFGPTKARFRFVDHHLAHAISAYSYSGLRRCRDRGDGRARRVGSHLHLARQ